MAHATPLSRRALLAISAAAAAGTASCSTSAALAQTVAPSPDAALIDMCSQWGALSQEWVRACHDFQVAEEAAYNKFGHLGNPDRWVEVNRDPAYKEADQRSRDIVRRMHPLFQAIGRARAVTLDGIMAKARVTATECLDGIEVEASEYWEGITPSFVALTLVRDLLAMHSAGEA